MNRRQLLRALPLIPLAVIAVPVITILPSKKKRLPLEQDGGMVTAQKWNDVVNAINELRGVG